MHIRQTFIRIIGLLLAAGVCALTLTGCGGPHRTPVAAGDQDGVHSGLPPGTASTVYTEALTVIYSWQPGPDTSPGAALQRAEPYLTGPVLAAARTTGPAVRSSVDWTDWTADHDIVTAVVSGVQVTARADGTAIGHATVTQIVQHVGGTTTPYQSFIAAAQLTSSGGNWKVATFPVPEY